MLGVSLPELSLTCGESRVRERAGGGSPVILMVFDTKRPEGARPPVLSARVGGEDLRRQRGTAGSTPPHTHSAVARASASARLGPMTVADTGRLLVSTRPATASGTIS